MKKENATDILARDILLLEAKRAGELSDLKNQVHLAFESIRPINLIKSTIEDVTHSPDVKGGIGKAAIGVATGFIVKKLLFGGHSLNPLKRLAGVALQTIVTNVAANNSDKIKEGGATLFEMAKALINRKRKKPEVSDFSQY